MSVSGFYWGGWSARGRLHAMKAPHTAVCGARIEQAFDLRTPPNIVDFVEISDKCKHCERALVPESAA